MCTLHAHPIYYYVFIQRTSFIAFIIKPKREAKWRARSETMSGLRMRARPKMRLRPVTATQVEVEATKSGFTQRAICRSVCLKATSEYFSILLERFSLEM